uniref:Tetratricopeptide repeat protein 29 n=1 Tax=Alexandrium andersonii TaxID=327968 RepID=A0A7S2IEW3_9DINO|mmetsp:Transcript_82627/g.184503  ORF Transcript_82627/g.184503 Transcript_82627/m.184503 type:complete len:851 (+) Transcript_82627:89-2641(+)
MQSIREAKLAGMGSCQPDLISDNLRGKYSCAADDGASSGKKREAAMLFSVAEGHLNDEVPDEALTSAKDALAIFKGINDSTGMADAQRLVMHATRMKATALKTAGDASEAEKILADAETAMRDELAAFTESGNKRGQAAMLLAVAEALVAAGGTPKKAEALDNLLDAQDLAQEVGDQKLEAVVTYEKAGVLHAKHNFKAALQAAKDAAALFKAVNDVKNEGLSWYSAGAAEINCGRLEEGLRGKTKALKLWKDIGDKKMQAAASSSFAEWYALEKDDFSAALSAAKESLDLYTSLGDQSGISVARCWVIEGYIRNKEADKAMEEANKGLEAAKEKEDQKATFWALECLARAQIASGDLDAALESAQEAMSISTELTDKRFKPRGMELVATVYLAMDNLEMAKEKAVEIEDAVKDLTGYEEEAFRSLQFIARVCLQKGSKETAQSAMEEARNIAQKAEDTYLEAQALLTTSFLDAVAGDLNKAVKAATLAKEMFHEEGYTRGEGRCMKALADYYIAQGDSGNAVRMANEGATLMEEFGDNRMAAKLKESLVSIFLATDQQAEAAKAAMDGLKLARMEEDKRATIEMLFMCLEANNQILQDAASDEKQSKVFKQGCEKMMRFAKEAVGLAVKVKDAGYEAAANYWVSHLHLLQGQVREGISSASKTISLAREVKDVSIEVRSMVLQAHAHVAVGEQSQAVKVLNDATAVASEGDDKEGKSMADALLETIVGSQQQAAAAAAWNPALMQQQFEAAAASAAPVMEYKGPEPMMVRQYLNGLVQNMTGSSDEIDGDTPLMESGIDSLASVELRTQLQTEFRLNLPSTVMFNYPTISTLTRLLVDECTSKKISWGA